MDFSELITSAHVYLTQFDYDHYPECFREFEVSCAPLFVRLESSSIQEAASELIKQLEEKNKILPKRIRKENAFQDKQVLALFLSPAAERASETAAIFSAELRNQWNQKYPRNSYQGGSYEQIMKGFDANLLGLPLRKSQRH